MHDFFKPLLDWYLQSLETGGYPLIVLLMFVESTFLPLPSELIIPPAAHLAYTKGNMSLTGIVLAGALGSWLGATAMYWVSRWAGRPFILRYGKFFLVTAEKVGKAERWSAAYGNFGIFASRLLPVVRHLIGIPAGIVRMDYWKFSLWTIVGSGLWCGVLCWLGIKAGQDEALMKGELHAITLWGAAILGVLGVIYYFFVHRQMQAGKK
ncbi:DedA family protein [Opitutus sp. GAS368]|uniref:DedA family protein n=1 Tax=Opitutus sp. GAS368 TaxID=1882749 RepID=UPI00087C2CCA|nr:DedA family protein [Opitutus sp. GAS368]SDR66644.1 membrane protein DedA, SNARE-associated domain [Opitutus sp. GAS368]